MSEFGPLATTVADLGLTLDVLAGDRRPTGRWPRPAGPLRVGFSAKPRRGRGQGPPRGAGGHWTPSPRRWRRRPPGRGADPPWRNGDAPPFLAAGLRTAAPRTPTACPGRRWRRAPGPRPAWAGCCAGPGRPRPARRSGSLARYRAWFEDHDLLLTPTLATPPLRVGAYQGKGLTRTLLGLTGYMPFSPAPQPGRLPGRLGPGRHLRRGPAPRRPAGRRPRRRGAAAVAGPPARDAAPLAPARPAGAGARALLRPAASMAP